MSDQTKPDPVPLPTGPQPIQELYTDPRGVTRFRPNKIVSDLLDYSSKHGFSLNEIAARDYPREDRVQFAQLIGYSLDGFSELRSYVTDEDYAVAELKFQNRNSGNDLELRNQYLRSKFKELQESMRTPMASLYECHPDDLGWKGF